MELLKTKEEFDQVYNIFEKSFIPSELRLYNEMLDYFMEQRFKIYGVKDSNIIKAAISVWEFNQFVYIEHFAVDPKYRNQNLGTIMINTIQDMYKRNIVLEVEPITDDMTYRRVEFYKRNQFCFNKYQYIQPPYRPLEEDVVLHVMTYPDPINKDQFTEITSLLCEKVYNRQKSF